MPLGKSSPLCNWHHLVFWMPGLGSTHLCGKIWEQDWKRSSLQNYKRLLLKRQIPDGAANLLIKSFDQTWSWAPPSRGRERERGRQRQYMRSRTWWSKGGRGCSICREIVNHRVKIGSHMNEWTLPGTLVASTGGGASVVSIFHLVFIFAFLASRVF